jgi:glutathione peroxidase-family protein
MCYDPLRVRVRKLIVYLDDWLTIGLQIQQFVKDKGVTFPVFGKIICEYGEQTNPLYQYLKYNVEQKAIRWNFSKFLCNKDGVPVKRFGTSDTFSMEEDIAKLLEDAPTDNTK